MRTTTLLLAAVLAVPACTNDAPRPSASGSPPATVTSTASQAGGAANALRIDGVDYAYSVTGTTRAGLTRITFANAGQDLHMASFARLNAGKTAQDVVAALGTSDRADDGAVLADPDAHVDGNPSILAPGASTTTYARLDAGRYAIVCFFAAKTDRAPHFAKGMVATIDVAAEPSAMPAPASDGEITAKDDALDLPDLSSGKGTFHYTNAGRAAHALLFVRLHDNIAFDDYLTWADAYFAGQARVDDRPGDVWGGLDAVTRDAYVELALPPGRYVAMDTEAKDASQPSTEYYRDEFGGLREEFTVA